jgi:hypothetical protein
MKPKLAAGRNVFCRAENFFVLFGEIYLTLREISRS